MPIYFLGGSIDLAANGSGELKLRAPIPLTVTGIFVNSTGRCEITNIDIPGLKDVFEGSMEVDHFKVYGNYYPLKEPVAIGGGQYVVFALKDISGAANKIYIALECTVAA